MRDSKIRVEEDIIVLTESDKLKLLGFKCNPSSKYPKFVPLHCVSHFEVSDLTTATSCMTTASPIYV
jgi:hypothetical protein